MKQKVVITILALCMIAAGGVTVSAYPGYSEGSGHGNRSHQNESGVEVGEHYQSSGHGRRHQEGAVESLELSEEQIEQMESIRAEEMVIQAELREKMKAYQEQMKELTAEEFFDEDAVRALAVEKAEIQVELTVAKARMRNKIQSILSAEQLESAEKNRSNAHHDTGSHHR